MGDFMDCLRLLDAVGVPTKKRGSRWWACCPLHSEHSASFMIDDHNRWHCFGCGQGGDDIDLHRALFKSNFIEAFAACRDGQSLPARQTREPPKANIAACHQKMAWACRAEADQHSTNEDAFWDAMQNAAILRDDALNEEDDNACISNQSL